MATLLANRPSDLFAFVGHQLGPTESILVDQTRINNLPNPLAIISGFMWTR